MKPIPYVGVELDSNGNGYVPLPSEHHADRIISVSFGDPEDDYRDPPRWKRHHDGGQVKIIGGEPKEKVNFFVWVAER